MSFITPADYFLDKCNRIYHESIKYLDIGFLPFLAVSRRTYHSRLVQLCDRYPSSLIYPITLLLSLYTLLLFFLLLPLTSLSISFLRILQPKWLRNKIPSLLEPQPAFGTQLLFIEPFIYQDQSYPTYFKNIFAQIQSSNSNIPTHHYLLLDSPLKLLSLSSYKLSSSSSLIPCFGGTLQNASVLLSQAYFLLKLTLHLFRSHRDLLLPWFCVSPMVFSSWSFSLVFLKRFLLHLTNTQAHRFHTYVLYEGLLRDLVFSRYLAPHSTTFYSHIPFFSKSQAFASNLLYIKSSTLIFEDPTAIHRLQSYSSLSPIKSLSDSPPPFSGPISSYKSTQGADTSIVLDLYSSNPSLLTRPTFCGIDSLYQSFSSSRQISMLLLPQGFLSESTRMLLMVDELFRSRPFLLPILNVYISLHPALKHNNYLSKQIQAMGLSCSSQIPEHSPYPLVTLCGESSSFNKFSANTIYPLAYLPSAQYSDSVFIPYITSPIQRIKDHQSLLDLVDFLCQFQPAS